MSKWRSSASGKVIIGGTAFDTDAPIVNFLEGPKWDARIETCIATETDPNPFLPASDHQGCKIVDGTHAYAYQGDNGQRFTVRHQPRPALRNGPKEWLGGHKVPYDSAKQVIKQFMIHHDGCATADMCFSVIQNERGLSCHFLLDNDGTIFQTLDLALEGWHGSELNANSIGIELCNRGEIRTPADAEYYTKRGMKRDRKPCEVNGHKINSWDFTEEQKDSMRRLGRALLRLLPNLPAEYPQESPGQQLRKTMPRPDIMGFSGYIGHYHLTPTKWDPGPWDFKDFIQRIRGAFCFPMFPRGKPDDKQVQPVVPTQTS
ncbi:MAG: peptidoglycan recognition family protein, partial [Kofleriaceae bacterium]